MQIKTLNVNITARHFYINKLMISLVECNIICSVWISTCEHMLHNNYLENEEKNGNQFFVMLGLIQAPMIHSFCNNEILVLNIRPVKSHLTSTTSTQTNKVLSLISYSYLCLKLKVCRFYSMAIHPLNIFGVPIVYLQDCVLFGTYIYF